MKADNAPSLPSGPTQGVSQLRAEFGPRISSQGNCDLSIAPVVVLRRRARVAQIRNLSAALRNIAEAAANFGLIGERNLAVASSISSRQ